MKIVWLCNIMLPVVASELDRECSVVGGWLTGIYEKINYLEDMEVILCYPDPKVKETYYGRIGKNSYLGFPQKKHDFCNYSKKTERIFVNMLLKENPDIVHIFGTEFPHTNAMIKACKLVGKIDYTILSIQGLISIIARHYYDGLPQKVINAYTFRDFVRLDNIKRQASKFNKRGCFEMAAIKQVKHVIGRTDFDNVCTHTYNQAIQYYKCNENLRDVFYRLKWEYSACEKYSVFFVNANYPVKGFHYVLEAASLLKVKYPNIKIYTTGKSPFENRTLKARLRIGTYESYLMKEIIQRDLRDNIFFCGTLDENMMAERLLASNCFVLPSTIENSPNSLGEAMLLGVPCVVADVGGVKNLITHEKEGYIYPSNAPYLMAYYIGKIFDMGADCVKMSDSARKHAGETHDVVINNCALFDIYQRVVNNEMD